MRATARAELGEEMRADLAAGQRIELRELPVGRVGIYVPAGRAAYPSTVVMCGIPARVAGVEEVIVMTAPGGRTSVGGMGVESVVAPA